MLKWAHLSVAKLVYKASTLRKIQSVIGFIDYTPSPWSYSYSVVSASELTLRTQTCARSSLSAVLVANAISGSGQREN